MNQCRFLHHDFKAILKRAAVVIPASIKLNQRAVVVAPDGLDRNRQITDNQTIGGNTLRLAEPPQGRVHVVNMHVEHRAAAAWPGRQPVFPAPPRRAARTMKTRREYFAMLAAVNNFLGFHIMRPVAQTVADEKLPSALL